MTSAQTSAPAPSHQEASNSQASNSAANVTAGANIPLIEKLLCRLKSLKRGHSHHSHGQSDLHTQESTPHPPALSTPSAEVEVEVDKRPTELNVAFTDQPISPPPNESSVQEEQSTQKHVVDLAELTSLCEELGLLLQHVRESQELATFTGTYPSTLQRRLDQDALELRAVYDQVREALRNIVRIKEQRRAVRKEQNAISKALVKIRDQEVREMEGLVSQFDKPLFSRWEKLKNTLQPELIENFLHDLKGKQHALDHMTTLANQKLSQLSHATIGSPANTTTSSTFSGLTPPGFLTALRDENKAGSSTATNRRNSVSGCVRINAMRWRKHHERATRSTSSSNAQENLPLSLVPLALNPTPAPSLGITMIPLIGPSTAQTAATTTATSSSNSLPSSPGSSIIPPNTPSAPPPTEEDIGFNIPGSSTETSGSLNLAGPACSTGGLIIGPTMPERRSMLQALFGDLRRSTELNTGNFVTLNHLGSNAPIPSLGPVSTAVVVTAPEDSQQGAPNDRSNRNTDSNRDIELFSLNRSA